MKVLLTGDCGFIGRHLRRAMEGRGWDVDGIDLQRDDDALDFFREDVTRYDLAVHCAAIVGGRASIDGSPLGVATNLALDAWYMQWLVRTGTPRAVYFSSSAAYPVDLQQRGSTHRLAEADIDLARPRLPDATYGLAKLAGEQLVPYAERAGTRVHVLRPMSGYGTDQALDYPFPSFIGRARRHADPFEIWGDGTQVRDWVHVDDVVAATLAVIDQDVVGPVNLATGRAVSFAELGRLVATTAGYAPQFKHLPAAPTGVHYRVGDPTRLNAICPPKVSLEEGIRRALDA